jgi:murein DD-endopeptidase MepM/ murein hydrolase activator NlpD
LHPCLAIPFRKGTKFQITEGWLYSKQERDIHGHEMHCGIDFAVPRGTPVLTAADGYALSSYHRDYDGKYQGKRVGFGLGHFVQMWLPDEQLFLQYGHLEKVADIVPYYPPSKVGEALEPRVVYHGPQDLDLSLMKPIKRGEVIGFVGDSGLSWGYLETPESRPDPSANPSWDEVHLHFEAFRRNEDGQKDEWWDPYGVYGDVRLYQSDLQDHIKAEPLWLTDADGQFLYADAPH